MLSDEVSSGSTSDRPSCRSSIEAVECPVVGEKNVY